MSNNRFRIGKSKPYKTIEAAPYVFTFYLNKKELAKERVDGTYLKIYAKDNPRFGINIPGNSEAYGFLFAAAEQGSDNQLLDYARIIFAVSMLLTTDQTFADDICLALLEWQKRKEIQAEAEAGRVTEEREQAEQTFMEDVAAYADAQSDKERKYMREGWKEEFTNAIKDADFTDNQQDN